MTDTPGETRTDLSYLVAEEIRVVMTRRRIAGRTLARKLNVSRTWLSNRLIGVQAIDLDDLARIAEALEVSVADLLPPGVLERRARPVISTAADVHRAASGQTTGPLLARAQRRLRRTVPAFVAPGRPGDNRPAGRKTGVSIAPTTRRPALIKSDQRPLAA